MSTVTDIIVGVTTLGTTWGPDVNYPSTTLPLLEIYAALAVGIEGIEDIDDHFNGWKGPQTQAG